MGVAGVVGVLPFSVPAVGFVLAGVVEAGAVVGADAMTATGGAAFGVVLAGVVVDELPVEPLVEPRLTVPDTVDEPAEVVTELLPEALAVLELPSLAHPDSEMTLVARSEAKIRSVTQ